MPLLGRYCVALVEVPVKFGSWERANGGRGGVVLDYACLPGRVMRSAYACRLL